MRSECLQQRSSLLEDIKGTHQSLHSSFTLEQLAPSLSILPRTRTQVLFRSYTFYDKVCDKVKLHCIFCFRPVRTIQTEHQTHPTHSGKKKRTRIQFPGKVLNTQCDDVICRVMTSLDPRDYNINLF